jgi:glycosyltransferase involved in cell wall biosynthesis
LNKNTNTSNYAERLHVVVMGDFLYPQGMAGTKRVQHVVKAFQNQNISCEVIAARQSTVSNKPEGVFEGTRYHTIVPNLIGWRFGLFLPLFIIKSLSAIRCAFKKDRKNILIIYGPPFLSNVFAVLYARKLGYKTVFDIVEDEEYAMEIAKDWRHRVKSIFNRYLSGRVQNLSDGLVVISSALEDKFRRISHGKLPLHFRSISIDPIRFPPNPSMNNKPPNMLYSGSFGVKDGISELLEAFDRLAKKHKDLKLVLTGSGTELRMKKVMERIEISSAKDRIDYKGYVDDDEYYEILAACTFPCMTRIDSGWANAGFPFKFGEFLATGRPVIASKVSDVEKYFVNGQDAMLVRAGSSNDIVAAIEYLLANPEKAMRIGNSGREKALALFDYRSQGKKLVKFLCSL